MISRARRIDRFQDLRSQDATFPGLAVHGFLVRRYSNHWLLLLLKVPSNRSLARPRRGKILFVSDHCGTTSSDTTANVMVRGYLTVGFCLTITSARARMSRLPLVAHHVTQTDACHPVLEALLKIKVGSQLSNDLCPGTCHVPREICETVAVGICQYQIPLQSTTV